MMTKKAQVVMLPTGLINKPGEICKFPGRIAIAGVADIGYPAQHLYFATDDEIKKADWIMYNGNQLFQVTDAMSGTRWTVIGIDKGLLTERCKKIVATTNKELSMSAPKCVYGPPFFAIGRIPTDFIEAYVREQGRIKEVLLEYIEEEFNDPTGKYAELKLRPNGTVIIHPVKPVTYSTEEFRKAVQMAFNDGANWAYNARIVSSLSSGTHIPSEEYFNKHYNN